MCMLTMTSSWTYSIVLRAQGMPKGKSLSLSKGYTELVAQRGAGEREFWEVLQ